MSTPAHKCIFDGAKRARIAFKNALKMAVAGYSLCLALTTSLPAQDLDNAPQSDVLRSPGWNYGIQVSAGSTVVQVSAPRFVTSGRTVNNLAVAFHLGRVLTHEHGPGLSRGTFEWGANIIPVEIFWVVGSHYAGGFEVLGPRWNFTHISRRAMPFVGLSGGLLFSPNDFPPVDTSRINFSAAIDVGVHLFPGRGRRSFDIAGRAQHISNAYLGRSNPGVPLSLQVTLGYSWY